eukprot:TRINITY_DN1480_c0_g1_i5.p3 TRINITY_DN1480_c0_g1~~TRINITY_DN1480_c0_g1_i5.p3  ORF type:complete len:103 (-),score=16.65 TRINITY_DN1480_c0_g1_i5:204-512(-)
MVDVGNTPNAENVFHPNAAFASRDSASSIFDVSLMRDCKSHFVLCGMSASSWRSCKFRIESNTPNQEKADRSLEMQRQPNAQRMPNALETAIYTTAEPDEQQ